MAEPIHATIDEQVKNDDIVLYMKGTPVFPMCGFSAGVVQLLTQLDVKYQAYNVLDDMDLREGIKTYSDWPTIPQLYLKGEFVGGFDIVREMAESGELQTMLKEKGLAEAGGGSQRRANCRGAVVTRRTLATGTLLAGNGVVVSATITSHRASQGNRGSGQRRAGWFSASEVRARSSR